MALLKIDFESVFLELIRLNHRYIFRIKAIAKLSQVITKGVTAILLQYFNVLIFR